MRFWNVVKRRHELAKQSQAYARALAALAFGALEREEKERGFAALDSSYGIEAKELALSARFWSPLGGARFSPGLALAHLAWIPEASRAVELSGESSWGATPLEAAPGCSSELARSMEERHGSGCSEMTPFLALCASAQWLEPDLFEACLDVLRPRLASISGPQIHLGGLLSSMRMPSTPCSVSMLRANRIAAGSKAQTLVEALVCSMELSSIETPEQAKLSGWRSKSL